MFAGGRKKGINSGLVDGCVFLKTFALDGPEIAGSSAGHEVNAGVFAAEVFAGKKFIPEPNVGEQVSVAGIGLQVCLHEPLEFVALVAFGEGKFSEMGEDGMEFILAHFFRLG